MLKKILIIVCSTITLLVGLFFFINAYTKYKIGYRNVCVASHQISQRSQISEDDLILIDVPKDYLNDDVYTCVNDVLEKYVKLGYSIPKGSLIYKTSLESNIGDLANTFLKEGEVNYDIYTSDVKINTANLGINMYIDMYLTIDSKDCLVSDLLLSNVRVTGLYDQNSKPILNYDKGSRVYIISVAIDSEYVNILNKAQVLGDINCVINKNTYNMELTSVLNDESSLIEYLQ